MLTQDLQWLTQVSQIVWQILFFGILERKDSAKQCDFVGVFNKEEML